MRTLAQYRDDIRTVFVANTTLQQLYGLNPTLPFADQFSAVSIEAAFVDVAAFVCYTVAYLFDVHKTQVETIIRNEKPHTLRWYREKALLFRFGQALITDSDKYSDAGLTEAQIAASKIVKHAAAIETEDGSGVPLLRIKTATEGSANLEPLTAPQLAALAAYFAAVKDAGVKLLVASNDADSFKSEIEIHYNPLLLDNNGIALNGGGEPARLAVDAYLRNLPFNGEFTIMALTDVLQKTTGVEIVQVQVAQARQGILPYQNTGTRFIPYAGYLRVYTPADLVFNYIPYNPNV